MPFVKAKDGVDIYYEVSGQGTPFLFLSETACDGAVWNIYQVPEFARDHRVVIVDYRGTGFTIGRHRRAEVPRPRSRPPAERGQ